MEILGGDDDRSGASGRRPRSQLAPVDAVHLDEDGGQGPATDVGGPGFAHALSAVVSPGALGLSGIAVALTTAMGGGPSLTSSLGFIFSMDSGPREHAEQIVTTFAFGAMLALGLGVAGILRSAGRAPAGASGVSDASTAPDAGWGRACSGAATILGLLLLAVALFSFSQISDLPESFG